jgi:hypothetical protein
MALFSSCYSAPEDNGGDENAQSGCGLAGVGSLEPLVETLKNSLLTASEAVIKRLRKRQVGRGQKVKKRKRQSGFGKKRKKRLQGAGRKKKGKKRQQGSGRKSKQARKCTSRSR